MLRVAADVKIAPLKLGFVSACGVRALRTAKNSMESAYKRVQYQRRAPPTATPVPAPVGPDRTFTVKSGQKDTVRTFSGGIFELAD